MTTPQDIHQARLQRDTALAQALAAEARIRALDTAIAAAQRAGNIKLVSNLQATRGTEVKTAASARADAAHFGQVAASNLGQWLTQTPEQIVATCTTDQPFVLLPVRLETKFAATATGGSELRVRIFPDDITIAPPPTPISDDEIVAGQDYWRARAASQRAPGDTALRTAYQAAWTVLATRFGAYRAGFLVASTKPQNPSASPGGLIFSPQPAPTVPSMPRADALPDRFVVLTYAADPATQALIEINRVVGAPIPDDLTLAPDAAESDSWLQRDPATGRIVVPDTLKWLVDFDAAVAAGMAVRIPLSSPFNTTGFARVIAVGLRTATPATDGPVTLEGLLSKHRYSNGCGLIGAGTPTNNTDSLASGWQPAAGDAQQLFNIEDAPPNITPQPGALGTTDGWRLGNLLGLSNDFVSRLPNATATDISEALTMNRAATPGTLDNFVGDFLKDVVTPSTAANLHTFFNHWVSGRALYPALRVGRQPYGIVVTSAWKTWTFPTTKQQPREPQDIAPTLYSLINQNRSRWETLAQRAPHAALATADPFQRLLSIIGLLASSTDFVSRKAVSDEYIQQRLRFGGADAASIQQWFDALRNARTQNLASVGFPTVTGPTDPLLAFMVFLDAVDEWQLPIIDRDPTVPLSETARVGLFNGTQNYLQWLAQASRADLVSENFVDANGKAVARPTALLYILLRHALLAALESSTLNAAQQFGSGLFDVLDRDPLIANINGQQHVLRKDYLEVDASRIGLTTQPTALADWALANARVIEGVRPVSLEVLGEVHDAIAALATLPTARLERLLAEHLDLCSYRLDAWITGLYSQRLAQLTAQKQTPGLYLGAFGWLENLRPAGIERQKLSLDVLPPALRTGAGLNLFEETDNGGYIHAPSLAQASSAAVLRNAYLSHASAAQPLPFAVNLSSARMRRALALTQGVRNGQPIGALLGYQLESGLHEGYPGVELDSYIYVLRDRFPLLSGRLTNIPDGTAADTIEARNVVDGLGLVEFTQGKAYPYTIVGLPAVATAEGKALAAEIENARDSLDAVSDLLLAESVHQAVQGNIARTKASLQALTEPEAPPEPEIIRTPRSGKVLTFRVALALDANGNSGWNSPLSPRALANPQLNQWLAEHLPSAANIQWTVTNMTAAPSIQSFASSGLEPIDLVLMSGDRLGDQSSELERYIIRRYRWDNNIADDINTVVLPVAPGGTATALTFDFSTGGSSGSSLSMIYPLLVRLRRLVTRARAIHAGDWRRSADVAQANPIDAPGSASGDPKLIAYKDLTDRLDAASSALTLANNNLKAKLASLATLLTQLTNDPTTFANPTWPVALSGLREGLFALVGFGIPEAVPTDGLTVTAGLISRLAGQAQAVSNLVDLRLATAAPLRATAFPDPLPAEEPAQTKEIARRNDVLRTNYIEAARALLGTAFAIIPLFKFQPDQASEIAQALATPVVSDGHVIDEWIYSTARVHAPIADLSWAMTAARWSGHPVADPNVLQFPHQPGTAWIGTQFGADLPSAECISVLVLNGAMVNNSLQAGLLIDDWTELGPTERETTGISFNFNRPNATAPQAILVAVPPALTGNWAFDDLIGSVHEALDLAHLRAVEPDTLIGRNAAETAPAGDYFQALPALLSEFSNTRFANIDYAARVNAVLASSKS